MCAQTLKTVHTLSSTTLNERTFIQSDCVSQAMWWAHRISLVSLNEIV